LIVEFALPIIHMHIYLNYKKNPPSKHVYKKQNALDIKTKNQTE
jgi:hypothetical protein